jgi:hypothetical protein
MIEEVEQCLEFLTVLKTDYVRVATKTNALHEACENLLEEQASDVNFDLKVLEVTVTGYECTYYRRNDY